MAIYLVFIILLAGWTLKPSAVLTGIHNFDLKRADGTTAAQRLFGQSFPNLFESVVDHMGEVPRPRQSSKIQSPNPLPRLAVPA